MSLLNRVGLILPKSSAPEPKIVAYQAGEVEVRLNGSTVDLRHEGMDAPPFNIRKEDLPIVAEALLRLHMDTPTPPQLKPLPYTGVRSKS